MNTLVAPTLQVPGVPGGQNPQWFNRAIKAVELLTTIIAPGGNGRLYVPVPLCPNVYLQNHTAHFIEVSLQAPAQSPGNNTSIVCEPNSERMIECGFPLQGLFLVNLTNRTQHATLQLAVGAAEGQRMPDQFAFMTGASANQPVSTAVAGGGVFIVTGCTLPFRVTGQPRNILPAVNCWQEINGPATITGLTFNFQTPCLPGFSAPAAAANIFNSITAINTTGSPFTVNIIPYNCNTTPQTIPLTVPPNVSLDKPIEFWGITNTTLIAGQYVKCWQQAVFQNQQGSYP